MDVLVDSKTLTAANGSVAAALAAGAVAADLTSVISSNSAASNSERAAAVKNTWQVWNIVTINEPSSHYMWKNISSHLFKAYDIDPVNIVLELMTLPLFSCG